MIMDAVAVQIEMDSHDDSARVDANTDSADIVRNTEEEEEGHLSDDHDDADDWPNGWQLKNSDEEHDESHEITEEVFRIGKKSFTKTELEKIQKKVIVQNARAGRLAELEELLNEMSVAERASSISEHDEENYSALHYAAHSDNLEMVKLLVQHGADVDDVGEADRRPLHLAAAAKKDHAKVDAAKKMSKLPKKFDGVVKFLLSKGARVNSEDSRWRTPLHIATVQGNTEAVLQLLAKDGIELNNYDDRKMTPLLLACLRGKIDIAIILIEKGADLTVCDDNYNTPLHIALKKRYKKIASRIIEKAKKSKNLKEIFIEKCGCNFAPIHLAVRAGYKELVETSLDHVLSADQTEGKDEEDEASDGYVDSDEYVDVVNFGGGENDDTPLHVASSAGRLEMAKLLMEKGAKINVRNWHGQTPLHHACKENHRKVAEFLLENGADINAKDIEDLAPLQVAANFGSFDILIDLLDCYRNLNTSTTVNDDQDTALELIKWMAAENKAEALQLLLHRGSKLHGVSDGVIVEFVFNAAKKGHTETVVALIQWKRSDVVAMCDDQGNTALHLASEAGHDLTVQELIRAKANVKNSNFDERTPLHLAAANGWIRTVKHLIKGKAGVDETDQYDITPLHLACKNAHIEIVKLLICKENADIVLRDKQGLNCLDYAIDNGHEAIANLILSHDKWHEVMSVSVSSLDDDRYERTTPMRKLIRNMPDIAERVMNRCVKVSTDAGPKDSNFWVEFDYEFLDDTFSLWDRPKDSDVEDEDEDDKTEETSFIINPKENADAPPTPTGSQYDDKGHLMKNARPYTTITKYIVANHPLNIMVSSERADLLSHPLVSSLLNHKWSRVGQYFFWLSFIFYLLFVAMLTGYVIVVPPSFYVRHANHSEGVTWFVNGEQRWTEGFNEATIFFFGRIGHCIIPILSSFNLLRELTLLHLQRRSYFRFGNLVEWPLHILAILLVLPLSRVQYFMGVSIPLDWQWQCGAVAVFLAWINLILFIRRFLGLGIYVIMCINILRTFMKFVPLLALFVAAFALTFYPLLMNQQPFNTVLHSFAKTFVMTIGALGFGNIFHSQNYLGTENTLADSEEDFFLSSVFYKGITYAIFILFIIMSILIRNLLVGLAVDDIHAIQEKAKLHRLAMQVELMMEMQRALPISIWRWTVIRFKRSYPNRLRCSGLQKWYRTLTGDQDLHRQAIQVSNKTATEFLDTKVEAMNGSVEKEAAKREDEMTQVRYELKQMKEQYNRLERKIDALLNHSNIKWDEGSKTESK